MQPPASALLSRMAVPFVVTAPPEAFKQPPLSPATLALHVAFMKVMTPFASQPKTWEHEQKQSSQNISRPLALLAKTRKMSPNTSRISIFVDKVFQRARN